MKIGKDRGRLLPDLLVSLATGIIPVAGEGGERTVAWYSMPPWFSGWKQMRWSDNEAFSFIARAEIQAAVGAFRTLFGSENSSNNDETPQRQRGH